MASFPRTRQTKRVQYNKVIYLIDTKYETGDFGQQVPVTTRRRVKAQRLEVSDTAYYNDASSGLRADLQFETYAKNYKGEPILEHNGEQYTIVRTRNVDVDKGVRLACVKRGANVQPQLAEHQVDGGFSDG